MKIQREEIRTGLLVVLTLSAFVGILIYLGAPGVLNRQNTYYIYFEDVLVAGRKIGQVFRLYSPVPSNERADPSLEVKIEVRVDASVPVYRNTKVVMNQPKILGDLVIDFTAGDEASGIAASGHSFVGERARGLAEAVPAVLDKLDPVLKKATATMEGLQKTADNLNKITAEGSDLTAAIGEFRAFGKNLNEISGTNGALRLSLTNVAELTSPDGKIAHVLDHLDALTGPEGSLAKAIENAERFTARLVNNRDVEVTLRHFRQTSEKLDRTVDTVGERFTAMGTNLEQASDTLKRQPWRLIWPTTKKYPGDNVAATQPGATPIPAARQHNTAAKPIPGQPREARASNSLR